jgi:hypothetical protein
MVGENIEEFPPLQNLELYEYTLGKQLDREPPQIG